MSRWIEVPKGGFKRCPNCRRGKLRDLVATPIWKEGHTVQRCVRCKAIIHYQSFEEGVFVEVIGGVGRGG